MNGFKQNANLLAGFLEGEGIQSLNLTVLTTQLFLSWGLSDKNCSVAKHLDSRIKSIMYWEQVK